MMLRYHSIGHYHNVFGLALQFFVFIYYATVRCDVIISKFKDDILSLHPLLAGR